MEASSCLFYGGGSGISNLALNVKSPSCPSRLRLRRRHIGSDFFPFSLCGSSLSLDNTYTLSSSSTFRLFLPYQKIKISSAISSSSSTTNKRRSRSRNNIGDTIGGGSNNKNNLKANTEITRKNKTRVGGGVDVRSLYQNGDPLGWKELGKCVVRWICQGMKAMASDFAKAELQGEFSEVRQRMGPGLTFIIQAQPYLNAVSMPLGLEAVCLKACTHYPTLFDHFQRELRDVLQRNYGDDWPQTQSWMLLKELANSAQHRAIARKVSQPKAVHGGLGLELEKVKAIQSRIDDFTKLMSDLLRIERDAELEFTQQELDAVPTPKGTSDSQPKPIEFLVSHAQAEQELCDTICNLIAVNTSTGLGGMHLVLFRVEGYHRLPPTTLSPGDMVCVRTCDSRGAVATSCIQGFVNNLGEDGCSISVALESRHGDPTFSKLFGKSVRIDRIHGLADALTYENNGAICRNCGMMKYYVATHPSAPVMATFIELWSVRRSTI